MRSLCLGLLVASSLTGALSGCAALAVGGAVGGAMLYSDRRTSGMQIEDQTIELKAKARVRETVGDRAHVNVTSYNRTVLITGEVPKEADKAAVGTAIAGVENVR
ncbi:MAG: BON domain-containing protein, partial [Methylibium sp.]|nr:BON domain-containing protein [Methylibium sp.]